MLYILCLKFSQEKNHLSTGILPVHSANFQKISADRKFSGECRNCIFAPGKGTAQPCRKAVSALLEHLCKPDREIFSIC